MRDKKTSLLKLKKSFIEYTNLIEWINPQAITLTLKQRVENIGIDIINASINFRHFINRLNRWFYGSAADRYNKSIQVVPIIEHNASTRYHYHAAIERPDHIDMDEFKVAIGECWLKTKWGYNHIDIQPMTDIGWIEYISKIKSKREYDLAIDWANLRRS
jgi:hypothetical protein